MNRPTAVGDLRVEQMFDEELCRYLRMARVVNVGRVKDPDELPPLYEPLLVAISPAAFSLAGFECVDGADFAQSWLVPAVSVSDEWPSPRTLCTRLGGARTAEPVLPNSSLHDCSGCFRLEHLPGGIHTHWKAPPYHGAHPKRSIRLP